MKKEISIIVPIYNGQIFVGRCLESVLRQKGVDRSKLEVIVLNDGSTDESLNTLNEYARRYPHLLTVIDQDNLGVAKTRNKGISMASGKYVVLIDQDDFIDDDYLARLHEAIEKGHYDVVQCGYKLVDADGKVVRVRLPIKTDFGRFLAMPAWAKIHKTQFLRDNRIEFLDNNIGEDSVFTLAEIIATKKYGTISYAGYNNSFDNASNVTNNFHKGLSEKVDVLKWLQEISRLSTEDKRMQSYLRYNLVRTAVYYLLAYGREASPERFMRVYVEIFGWLEDFNKQNVSVLGSLTAPRGEQVAARVAVIGFILIHRMRIVKLFTKIYCRGEV